MEEEEEAAVARRKKFGGRSSNSSEEEGGGEERKEKEKGRKLPPGPIGLPIVGNLFDIGPRPHESLAKLAEKHGPLMTVCLGSITNVVASSTEIARKIIQKNDEACSGRFVPDTVTALHDYSLAVV
ncbi:hypothetical protein LguiA_034237 [Lonicera macranthoides]